MLPLSPTPVRGATRRGRRLKCRRPVMSVIKMPALDARQRFPFSYWDSVSELEQLFAA